MLVDKIIHSRRKTIAVIVQRDGRVIVRAPRGVPNAHILRFVEEKAAWIQKKQAEIRRRNDQAARKFEAGEQFLYLGQPYPLRIDPASRNDLLFKGDQFFLAQKAQPRAAKVFTTWYQKQAHLILPARAVTLATLHGLSFERVRISSARTRWGSCSSLGTLSFTWRLVMAPPEVIDYVIVHELAHTVEHNHSPRFWTKVAEMMPEYDARLRWLKQNGYRLTLE